MNSPLTRALSLSLLFSVTFAELAQANTSPAKNESTGATSVSNGDGWHDLDRLTELYGEEARWGIHRKNKRIGTHTVSFDETDDALVVTIESVIRVSVLKIPVYRFRYLARERWTDGELMKASATVTENGKVTHTLMRRNEDRTIMRGPDGESEVPALQYATNHWHAGVLEASSVFNTITGTSNDVQITADGSGQLEQIDGDALTYTRYRYDGQLNLESWYDDSGRWLGMRFPGEDGNPVEYRLESDALEHAR